MPSVPMPNVREYLPDMPTMPKVPLPEPVDNVVTYLFQLDQLHISPMIQRINYLILVLSLSSMLMSSVNDLLVFKPVNIINMNKVAPANSTDASIRVPFVWTFTTSVFVETNFLFLVMHIMLINYVIIKNKTSLEQIWKIRDLFTMLCVSGFMATCTHFVWRLCIYAILKNEQTYSEFEYCSINFIVMALMLGLRQASSQQIALQRDTTAIQFTNPTIKTEFDSGIPFISGNIVIPYSILP
jgi:hypothetical protein